MISDQISIDMVIKGERSNVTVRLPRGLLSIYRSWATSGPEGLNLFRPVTQDQGGSVFEMLSALKCHVTVQFSSVQMRV